MDCRYNAAVVVAPKGESVGVNLLTAKREDGYILTAALASLFAIALVATALVSTSANALARVQRAEKGMANDFDLKSAIFAATAHLGEDPRLRRVTLSANFVPIAIEDRTVDVRVTWERQRLNINQADDATISVALKALGASDKVSMEIRSAVNRRRLSGAPIQLLDNLDLRQSALACAQEALTIFGGIDILPDAVDFQWEPVTQGTSGSRIRIDARLKAGDALFARTAVVEMTGDPNRPFAVLDWRKSALVGDDACRPRA